MNAKHTPGPWQYRQPHYDKLRGMPVRTLEVLPVSTNGMYKPYIADVRSLDADGNDNTEANARLIAAAPDLLAALEEAEQFIGDRFDPEDEGENHLLKLLQAAIARAKGE